MGGALKKLSEFTYPEIFLKIVTPVWALVHKGNKLIDISTFFRYNIPVYALATQLDRASNA